MWCRNSEFQCLSLISYTNSARHWLSEGNYEIQCLSLIYIPIRLGHWLFRISARILKALQSTVRWAIAFSNGTYETKFNNGTYMREHICIENACIERTHSIWENTFYVRASRHCRERYTHGYLGFWNFEGVGFISIINFMWFNLIFYLLLCIITKSNFCYCIFYM